MDVPKAMPEPGSTHKVTVDKTFGVSDPAGIVDVRLGTIDRQAQVEVGIVVSRPLTVLQGEVVCAQRFQSTAELRSDACWPCRDVPRPDDHRKYGKGSRKGT